jgi:hypothetical protein
LVLVGHRVDMTTPTEQLLAQMVITQFLYQQLHLAVEQVVLVIVRAQGVVQDRVDRVVVVGTNTDQVAQALSGKAMLVVHPAHHHHMAQVAVAQVALAEITIAVQAATAALV